jgi:hypothetical protein
MARPEKSLKAKEFAKEHWPKMVAGTVAGAAILLLIHFYRKHREKSDPTTEKALDHLAGEAVNGRDQTSTILETGVAVMKTLPADIAAEATAMAEAAPSLAAQETMEALSKLGKK